MSVTKKCCFATLPKTERGRPIQLGGDPKGNNFLYCHGNSVYIRNIENPTIVDIYTEHARETTVAKYSPSGYYIASADITGKVRIWDTVNPEHILKKEFQPLGRKIKDLDWSPDSTKIVVVGDGSDQFAAVFTADSGNTVGSIHGHTKEANSCAYKPTRPFRIATSSEDHTLSFAEGPPFKCVKSIRPHTNFVNCVRYSPTGDNFISGGADGKAYIFDGITGEQTGELGAPAHKAGIYGLSYNADGSQILSVSADKTAKIWDVATGQLVTEFTMGKDVRDMQVGCLWQGQHILTVSLSGFINYLDKNNPTQPLRIIKGHNKPITALAISADKSELFTGTSDAAIAFWNVNSGSCEEFTGKGHTNQVADIAVEGELVYSVGLDDTVRIESSFSHEYSPTSTKLDSQPRAISKKSEVSIVAGINHITVLQGERKLSSLMVKYEPMCVDIHPGMTIVAVGGTNTLVIYELSNGALSEIKSISQANCNVGGVKYSPDGAYLIAVGSDKSIRLFEVACGYSEVFNTTGHAARINSVAWSPDGKHFATSSIDGGLSIWIPENSYRNKIAFVKDAHTKSWANKIDWIDNNTVVTVGQDSNVKQWTVNF